jgi:hypothetical protein
MVLGAGAASSMWAAALGDRVSVLASAREIAAGERIELSDLRTVDVAADTGLAVLGVGERDGVVGQLATVTVPAGSLLQPAHLTSESLIPSGRAVVGVSLEPGALPVYELRVGDRVAVVDAAAEGHGELGEAEVFAVRAPGASTGASAVSSTATVVSLLVARSEAAAVARAAGANEVRLVLVEQTGSGDR